MGYIQPEVIAEARKVDLFSYLQATDPDELVKCDGNEYCTRTHDSLKISNGKWFWWSRGIGGASALDYLVKVRGVDFVTAVEAIMGTVEIPHVIVPEHKKYDRLCLPAYTFQCQKARKYLISRGIDERLIDDCIGKKLIAEDKKTGAVLFLGYDESGSVKHCSMRASDGSSTKKDVAGSDKHYAFRLLSDRGNKTVRVFESAIDLLSYVTVLKTIGKDYRRENLISLSGIYLPKKRIEESKVPYPLEQYLLSHPQTEHICLYLDNDFAGKRGAEALEIILGKQYEVRYIPPPVGKDYNDYLMCIRSESPSVRSNKIQFKERSFCKK